MPTTTSLRLCLGLAYGAHPRQGLDVLLPEDLESQTPLIALLPGGWWRSGERTGLRTLGLALAERGLPVALIGHRPLGDSGSQDGRIVQEDLAAALAIALEEAACAGARPRQPVLLGLGASFLSARLHAGQAQGDARPGGLIGVSPVLSTQPWPGASAEAASRVKVYAGAWQPDAEASTPPAQLPAVLILAGRGDAHPLPAARELVAAVQAAEGRATLIELDGQPAQLDEHWHPALGLRVADEVARFVGPRR